MVNMNDLEWGLQLDNADNVLAAYGARTIFKSGQMDFPHDRQSFLGEETLQTLLRKWINSKALPALRKHIQEKNWVPSTEETFTFEDWPYALKASPRGSHGYIYIGAYMKGLDQLPEIDDVEVKWSGDFIPKIGDTVFCRVNGIGQCKVLGYYVENGWIVVIALPGKPPEWFTHQNGKNAICGLFGTEIQKLES